MVRTAVTIHLYLDDIGLDEATLKKEVYQYLNDLIEDDSLVYYVEETNNEK